MKGILIWLIQQLLKYYIHYVLQKVLNHAHFDEPLSKSVTICFRTGMKKVGMSIQLKGLFLHDFLTRRFSFCSFMKCILI